MVTGVFSVWGRVFGLQLSVAPAADLSALHSLPSFSYLYFGQCVLYLGLCIFLLVLVFGIGIGSWHLGQCVYVAPAAELSALFPFLLLFVFGTVCFLFGMVTGVFYIWDREFGI